MPLTWRVGFDTPRPMRAGLYAILLFCSTVFGSAHCLNGPVFRQQIFAAGIEGTTTLPQVDLGIVVFVMAEVLSEIPEHGVMSVLSNCVALEGRLAPIEIAYIADYLNRNHQCNGINAFTEDFAHRPPGAVIIPPNAIVRVGLGFLSSALTPLVMLSTVYESDQKVTWFPTGWMFDEFDHSDSEAKVERLARAISQDPKQMQDLSHFVLKLREAMRSSEFAAVSRAYQLSLRGAREVSEIKKVAVWNYLEAKLAHLSHLTNYQATLNFFRQLILR